MPMKRVPPGTLPKFDPHSGLSDFYRNQQLRREHEKLKQNPEYKSPLPEDAGKFAQPKMGEMLGIKPEESENINRSDKRRIQENISTDPGTQMPDFTGPRPDGYWGRDSSWKELSPYQKAAAMALLEADSKQGRINFMDARNAMGAMINRADKEGEDLGDHVSRKIYQPTIEPQQYSRLAAIVQMPQFQALTELAEQRATGKVGDWVDGATHFLAKPSVMLKLEADNPEKYKSWRKWTGYDDATGTYKNEVMADNSHVFLAPEGKHSAGGMADTSNWGPGAELAGSPSALKPFPEPSYAPTTGEPTPELPKLADMFGVPGGKKLPGGGGNQLADLQSAPFKMTGFEGLPEQDDRAFALLPAQQRRPPAIAAGQPQLPVPRRPPGYPQPS
jgi:hypothetical protein